MRVTGGTRELRLHQWSNDWISADPVEPRDADKPMILSPMKVQLNPAEVATMRADEAAAHEAWADNRTPTSGTFWREWIMSDDGYFKRRMHYGRRPPVRASGSS